MTDPQRSDAASDPGHPRIGPDEGAPVDAGEAAMAVDPEAGVAEDLGGDAAGAGDSTPEGDGEPVVDDPLVVAQRERDDYLDALRRERAEFENYRKRATRERAEALDQGAARLVTGMLGVLDNFAFALDAAERSEDEQLAKGVRMVHEELVGVLRTAGLEDVPGQGHVFDPAHHEAMLSEDAEEDLDEPVVAEVLRAGYRFKGRVLRPAAVKVRR